MTPDLLEAIKSRMPPREILEEGAPYSVWLEAVKQAARSPHMRHRTGAVIFHRSGDIVSKGCAHPHQGSPGKLRSLHAERHALQNWPKPVYPRFFGTYCLIVTLTRSNGFASVSKPCADCRQALMGKVDNVVYVERTNVGSWELVISRPHQIKDPCFPRYL